MLPANNSSEYGELLDAAAKIEGLDVGLALGRLGGMREVLENAMRQVCRSINERLENMERGLTAGDLQGFGIDAHSLKAAFANIGADGYSGHAARLEFAAASGNILLCNELFHDFAKNSSSFAAKLRAVLIKAPIADKPKGDYAVISSIVSRTIACLVSFDAADALASINELTAFTFDINTDSILADAKEAIDAFDYDTAIHILSQL